MTIEMISVSADEFSTKLSAAPSDTLCKAQLLSEPGDYERRVEMMKAAFARAGVTVGRVYVTAKADAVHAGKVEAFLATA